MPDATDESPILVEQRDGYRVVTLNRPARLNAFTIPMHQVLAREIAGAEADKTCRALLITGTGRAFSTGQDLNERVTAAGDVVIPGEALEKYYNPLVLKLRALPFPVVCAVNGIAAGASCNIALGCDIVLAARSASFLQPFARLGIIPDAGGTWLLPRLVGQARARGLALLAEPISAETGGAMGPDLEGGRRRQADERGGKALRAFRQRADLRLCADQARVRRGGGQRSFNAARPRTQTAARGRIASGLCGGREGVSGEAQADVYGEALVSSACMLESACRAVSLLCFFAVAALHALSKVSPRT